MYKKDDFITDFSQFEQWRKDHDYKEANDQVVCLFWI